MKKINEVKEGVNEESRKMKNWSKKVNVNEINRWATEWRCSEYLKFRTYS